MKIKEVIEEGKNALSKNNIEDDGIIVRELLAFILGVTKQYLVIHLEDELNAGHYIKFKENINEITEGKPLQYITKNQEFMGLNFFVNENVLIPQPDTEIIVEETLKKCKDLIQKNGKIRILDLCTGSGAIAVSLSNFLGDKAEVFASDISTKALEVAKNNNEKNNTNVRFIESNLFENIQEQKFNIIVSNPPYIRSNVINNLPKQVQNEPHLALDGGEDGLEFYKKIIEQACKHIENGYLILEIGYDQKEDVESLIRANKNYEEIKTMKDLSGNDRCVVAKVCI